jgi:hypothetical protein
MPNIDPSICFYIGGILIVTQIIDAGGPALLQNAIPAAAIAIIIAWCAIITKIGIGLMTYISGVNATAAGRIASIKSVPIAERAISLASDNRVAAVQLKDQATADAISSDKVVGPKG